MNEPVISDKCAHCRYGQFQVGAQRLCNYGVQAIPVAAMRHPASICGPEAKMFEVPTRYSEYED